MPFRGRKFLLIIAAAIITSLAVCGCGDKDDQHTTVVQILSSSSLTVIPEPFTETVSPQPFCESDLSAGDKIMLGLTQDNIRDSLGEPITESVSDEDDYADGLHRVLTYEGFTLEFYDVLGGIKNRPPTDSLPLSRIVCRTKYLPLARGLHVGCTAQEIMASFRNSHSGFDLHLNNSVRANGKMIYGTGLGGIQHEDTYTYAYIDKSGMDAEQQEYYSIVYCFEKPLVWYGSTEVDLCDTYSIRFFLDAGTDIVTEIILERTAAPWTQATHSPQ